ncbi:MAG TPA: hypothetical protein PLB89_04855 [Flavobacteriales bacterium]|nr:hypothetical protein [Flavobacteriales bacterium]
MRPTPRFRVGQVVSSYGFGWFTVEKVYWDDGYFYDLREQLSPKLLKMTHPEVKHEVPEKYVREIAAQVDQ